ncbi:MAG: ThiF family adenylyltransferase, partial [Deltaproteobacteria bacterium]|nr:ThiF family adenylyltransferase [Deltaproteobacteria bacterium]
NLHRQILYTEAEVGQRKVDAAAIRLRAMNAHIVVAPIAARLTAENAERLLRDADLVLDGTDTFAARYDLSDACARLGKPLVHGSVHRFTGQVSVFDARTGPCYRCLYPAPPPDSAAPACHDAGVLGVLPGLVGLLQATEAIKWIAGIGTSLAGRLLVIDAESGRFRMMTLAKDPACPACGAGDRRRMEKPPMAANPANPVWEIAPRTLHTALQHQADLFVLDVRETWELAVATLHGAVHIPHAELLERTDELPHDREIVLICRNGRRSLRALEQLRAVGFTRLKHLHGGLTAWAQDIDPTMAMY